MPRILSKEAKATLCKFHGKFTDLIPYGFKFHKVFANNYRSYCINTDGNFGDSMIIWQHHSGYVELNDFHDASKTIIEAIITGSVPLGKYNSFALNIKNNTRNGNFVIEPFDNYKHEPAFVGILKEEELGRDLTDDEVREVSDEVYGTWRRCAVDDRLIEIIKDFYNKGWIKI